MLCLCVAGLAGFRVFVEAVFYVGKGKKNNRPIQHLIDARDAKQKTGPVNASSIRSNTDISPTLKVLKSMARGDRTTFFFF